MGWGEVLPKWQKYHIDSPGLLGVFSYTEISFKARKFFFR
jgi:hypothetical protein